MSNAGIQYSIGGDASGLGRAFQHALRFTGDFTDQIKRAFSVRGLFDGLASGLKSALGGSTFGEIFGNALKKATGKEVLQQNFAGLLGGNTQGEQQAAATIDAIKAFSDDANIAVEELNDAAREMLAAGANGGRAVQDIKMLGEVARGLKIPIGELTSIWAKMFADGEASQRELMSLQKSGVDIQGALANSLGISREEVKKMGTDGKISFGMVEAAMQSLTGPGGRFAGQIDRFKGTFAGLVDDIQDELQKIPTAFFSGILSDGMSGSKDGLRDITRIVEGWVRGAREFGTTLAAVVRVGKGLSDDGKLWGTLGDGLISAFGGAVDYLVKAMAGVATGLGAALLGVFETLGDVIMSKLPAFLGGDGRPMPDMGAAISQVGGNFIAGFKTGWDGTNGPGLGDAASKRFNDKVGPMMFEARGGVPGVMDAVMQAISANTSIPIGGSRLNQANGAEERDLGGRMKIDVPNAMAKVGMFVGAGGPQGAANDTAKNTGKMTGQLDKVVRHMDKIASWKEVHGKF